MTDTTDKATRIEQAGLVFLPQPWQISIYEDQPPFTLDSDTRIQIGPDAGEETLHAAETLQRAVNEVTGLPLPISRAGGRLTGNVISLILLGRDDAAFSDESFGFRIPPGLPAQYYGLRVLEGACGIAAGDEAGLFYGAQTLIQLVQQCGRALTALRVLDRPALANRGVMLDVSRMKVLTPETLAQTAEMFAHFKYNQIQLYTEHTYRFERHPTYGLDSGAITANDVLMLDDVCRRNHIDFVPNYQALGHQRELLENPKYAHLAETDWRWSFATDSDETFAFLDGLFGEMLPNFSSDYVNIDADEPWDMGRGVSKAMTAEIGSGRVYLHHIKRIYDLVVKKHGRTMMMWADMFWHYGDLIGEFPDDIVLLDWWYEPKERYDTVDVLADAKRRFYVCPGTGSWMTLFPRIERSIANIQGFVRDGVAAGAEGMLMTDWGDNGAFQMFSLSRYAFLWAAECAWSGAVTPLDDFDRAFSRLVLRDLSGQQLAAIRKLGTVIAPDTGHAGMQRSFATVAALWGDPLVMEAPEVLTPDVTAALREAADAISPLLDTVRDPGFRHDLGFAAAQVAFACDQVDANRRARAALGETGDKTAGALADAIATLQALQNRIPAIMQEFETRWLAHARHSQIEVNLQRYADVYDQYSRAIAWLEGQRDAAQAGQPVDADLSTYDTGGYLDVHQTSRAGLERLIDVVGGYDNLPPDIKGWLARPEDPTTVEAAQ